MPVSGAPVHRPWLKTWGFSSFLTLYVVFNPIIPRVQFRLNLHMSKHRIWGRSSIRCSFLLDTLLHSCIESSPLCLTLTLTFPCFSLGHVTTQTHAPVCGEGSGPQPCCGNGPRACTLLHILPFPPSGPPALWSPPGSGTVTPVRGGELGPLSEILQFVPTGRTRHILSVANFMPLWRRPPGLQNLKYLVSGALYKDLPALTIHVFLWRLPPPPPQHRQISLALPDLLGGAAASAHLTLATAEGTPHTAKSQWSSFH